MNDELEEVTRPEVPRHLDRLEDALGHLVACVKELERRCAAVLSCPGEKEVAEKPAFPGLCTLACALRTFTLVTETACEDIESLMKRLEL